MKISEKQTMLLFILLKDTLRINDTDSLFSLTDDLRLSLFNEIVNQQSSEVKEIKKTRKKEELMWKSQNNNSHKLPKY